MRKRDGHQGETLKKKFRVDFPYYFYVEHTSQLGAASLLEVSKTFFFFKTRIIDGRKCMRTPCELWTVLSKYLDSVCSPVSGVL